jgi:hypothetical protein
MLDFPENYTPAAHDLALLQFLQDHPEHAKDCRFAPVDGRVELCVATDAMRVFVAWALAQGMVPAQRQGTALALLERLRDLEREG